MYKFGDVVYHLVPTSNHNRKTEISNNYKLFIILFLHQTTTVLFGWFVIVVLFIILFLHQTTTHAWSACNYGQLFIILFLHQTTTPAGSVRPHRPLFIILFLHQTTTPRSMSFSTAWLFIILFLHQTTTLVVSVDRLDSCLSSCSYIKPQPIAANLLVISKILRFWLLRNGRAGRFLLQIY